MRYFGYISLLIVVLIAAWWSVKSFRGSSKESQVNSTEAIAAAKALYLQQKSAQTNFSNGPCLSNEVISNWAVDIAHNPRIPIDNLPQNQCSSYQEGKVKHFVELDPDGNLIKSQ